MDEASLLQLIKPGTKFLLDQFTGTDTTTLEVGCGPGQYRLAVKGTYIGIDITSQDYRGGLPRHLEAIADARTLPFKSDSFNLILFSNIFHYFENGVEILKDCFHLTKSGGRILIVDYSYPSLKNLREAYKKSSPDFTACLHKSNDWLEMLTSAGYHNQTIRINSTSLSSNILRSILPVNIFHNYLDTRDLSIAVIGEK